MSEERVIESGKAVRIHLPNYPCTHIVTGARKDVGVGDRNNEWGAIAISDMGNGRTYPTSDPVTRMALADVLASTLGIERNPISAYGAKREWQEKWASIIAQAQLS